MILNSEFEIRNSKLILSSRAALPPFEDAELNEWILSSRAVESYPEDAKLNEGSPCGSRLSFRLWQGGAEMQSAECRVKS